MEMSAMVKEYLEKKNITAACRTENVFIYQAPLAGESRISGCEVLLREVGEDLLLTAVLPISVRIKEARGVARWLANLNGSRTKPGFFELDNLAGRIQFRVKMHGPMTGDQLEVGIRYCLEQVEAESDQLTKLVCDESRAVREEEMAAIRKKQAAEAQAHQTPLLNAVNKVLLAIGLKPQAAIKLEDLEEEDEDERLTFKAAEAPQPELPENTDEEPEEDEVFVEPVEVESVPEAAEAPADEAAEKAE